MANSKILFVDDEQEAAQPLIQALISGGFDVITAITGLEGIQKAKTDKPNIILLDQILPDMAGNQVLQTLKHDPLTNKIPVAMISNFTKDDMIHEALQLGAVEYIIKYQISAQDLIDKVTDILKEQTPTEQPPVAAPLT